MTAKPIRFLPLSLAAVLTACFGGAAAKAPQPLAAVLPGSQWKLAAYEGAPVPSLIKMSFGRDGSVSGLAICNSFAGKAGFTDRTLRLRDLTQTLLGCELTGHRSAQRSVAALLAMEDVPARITPAGLELKVKGRRLLLVPDR